MKQKSKLFLNIATIALCLCAIAVGVYSAKTASLNVGGQIGFEAHNCDVDVKVYMYGHSDTAGGAPIAVDNKVDKTSSGAIEIRGENETLSLGTAYFTDANSNTNKPENIVIDFEFTNKSKFKVDVSVTKAECANVTITNSGVVTMDATGGTTTTGKLSITLALNANDSGVYSDIDPTATANANNLNISIKLEKASLYKLENKVNKFPTNYDVGTLTSGPNEETTPTYAQSFPYYITMGEVTKEDGTKVPINWLIIGKMDHTTNKAVPLTNDDKTILESHKLSRDIDYVLLSEKILIDEEYYGTSGLGDYAICYARYYLMNPDINSPYGFAHYCGFTQEELDLITPRNIQEIYTAANSSSSSDTFDPTENDTFWLLSRTEIEDLFAQGAVTSGSSRAYYMSARTNKITSTTTAGDWWLFGCPMISGGGNYFFIPYIEGGDQARRGIRPACII